MKLVNISGSSRKRIPVWYLWITLVLFLAPGCKTKLPAELENALVRAGSNRPELQKVLDHYSAEADSLKLRAAEYLITGMRDKHSFISFKAADSTGKQIPFNVLDYPDYNSLLTAWDELEALHGKLEFVRDTTIIDIEVIQSGYLIRNIDLAFKAWQLPWSSHLDFHQFCEYILPYRSTNEPLEEWRPFFLEYYSWLPDSMKGSNDPLVACRWINNEIRSWFRFDERFYEHPTDQGMKEIMEGKKGRCEDMTNIAIMAMRTWGIPVMSDFTPYWANTGNNHAWNAVLDLNDNPVIFMGGEANPGDYKLINRFAKVYRKTFAPHPESLMENISEGEEVPPYLNSPTLEDVTSEYTQTFSIDLQLQKRPDSTEYAYLCVFNSGEWKPVAWALTDKYQKAVFKNMGPSVAYLPAWYRNGKVIPAHAAILLQEDGSILKLEPSIHTHTVMLTETTLRAQGQTTDHIKMVSLQDEEPYELFYWRNKWISLGVAEPVAGTIYFANVPEKSLLWLTSEKLRKEERIFTMDGENQVWW